MPTMASKRDYYEVLGVERSASESQIRAAYRKLAIRYHPDHSSDDDAGERFKEAAEAFEVLSDADKRARYDQFGHAGVEGATHDFGNVGDIFDAFGSIFSDIFGQGRARGPRRGADVRCFVNLTLEEAASGATKTVEINLRTRCDTCKGSGSRPGSSPQRCSQCNGQGQVVQFVQLGGHRIQTASPCPQCRGAGTIITSPCVDCGGAGVVKTRRRMDVKVPPGVDNGTRLQLPGEGEPSFEGGPPGNCHCIVRVREHSLFHREGPHLLLSLPITFSQAALGATIEVPTLQGRDEVKIPPGTQTDEDFVLRGRGMPDHRTGRSGDLFVRTHIEVPKKLSKRQSELLRELAELEHVDVTPKRKSFLKQLKSYFAPADEKEEEKE